MAACMDLFGRSPSSVHTKKQRPEGEVYESKLVFNGIISTVDHSTCNDNHD
jgi:hypothetical protein